MSETTLIHYYYVDEAGDPTLFNRKGRILVGNPGVSKYFMVGVAHIPNPAKVKEKLLSLRKDILSDPYFSGVPSMQPENRKTAICFHACKDLPEVRREVFKILPSFGIKFQAVIRRKMALAEEAKEMFNNFGIKVTQNQIYDDLIKRLFRNLLHKADKNNILIARRGTTDRINALHNAILSARKNFRRKYNIISDSTINIETGYPNQFYGLQAVDYYLWSLQRLFERGEDRFFNLLSSNFSLIIDLDDKRNNKYGEYYSKTNPLELKKIKPFES